VVYHSFLKTPLDLVMVRLVKMPENKIFRAKVTDKNGRFFFLVQPGTYRLEVTKPGFNFPSAFLSQIKDDSIYLDVYHGEIIEVRDKDVIITPNVPLDPLDDKPKTPAQIKRTQLFRQIQKWISATGIVVAAAVCFVQTAVWSFALLGLQIAVYLLVLRLAAPRRPKSWGIVYDKETNKPLSNVIVRIFEPKYQKLLETAITDNKGRYAFLLGPNEYSSTYEKGGYRPHETEVNFSNEQDLKELSKDIHLEPKKEN
jgi:hypothetical protein